MPTPVTTPPALPAALRQPEGWRVPCRGMEAFMVRLWKPGDGERVDGLRGTALHFASGRQISFSAADGLIAFLTDTISDEASHEQEPTQIEPADNRRN